MFEVQSFPLNYVLIFSIKFLYLKSQKIDE